MDTNKLITLVKSPELAGSDDLPALSLLLEKYPYFQAARLLFAKASGATAQTVKVAAAYTTERSILQRIMDRDFNSNVNLPTLEASFLRADNFNAFPHLEETLEQEPITDITSPTQEEMLESHGKMIDQGGEDWGNDDLPSTDELIARLKRFEINKKQASLEDIDSELELQDLASLLSGEVYPKQEDTEISIPEYPDMSLPFVDFAEDSAVEINHTDFPLPDSGWFTPFQQAIEGRDHVFSKKTATDSRDYQDFIIERFIQGNPCLSSLRDKVHTESNIEDHADLSAPYTKGYQTVATETLALILTHQGKITQAIDIYRALQLKYPDKSIFFAREIEVLKEKFHQSDKS